MPQSNQRGIETTDRVSPKPVCFGRLNRTSVGLKPRLGGEAAPAPGRLNRTSVGLKRRADQEETYREVASIEPAWD